MSIQIQTPNITAATDRERLQQIQSYLYRMARQLQWAFDTIDTSGASAVSSPAVPGPKTAPAEQASTFSDLKDLIIKSSDIVNAYYAQISKRLESKYVAQSDFGTYREETALELQAGSNAIAQLFTETRQLTGTVEELYDSTMKTRAYLKTGLLEETPEGTPIYGLEVGQTTSVNGQQVFDKFARFTAERLSFFDRNEVEVAYISDYHLYITNASISGSLKLMEQFEIALGNGTVDFKWMGG